MTEQMTSFVRAQGVDAKSFHGVVEVLFERSYAETYAESESVFRSTSAFMQRFEAYSSNPRLDMVVAYREGNVVGQSWGWPDDGKWRLELTQPLSPAEDEELGGPSFALSEIMVDKDFWGRGLARELHNELLRGRPEKIASLFVDPVNTRAYERYHRWGWYKIGTSWPGWEDAPVFDVLVGKIPDLLSL